MPINDNDDAKLGATLPVSDSHGHAALLLVESLIHGLCETAIISAAHAVEIVERAISVQADQAEAADAEGAPLWRSHALLLSIAASLRIDGDNEPTPPQFTSSRR